MYHINVVDEVTQYQHVGTVAAISEAFLIPVLEALIEAFPFAVQGFHADNGSEYINRQVAALLNKLHIGEFTKSRARHSNDNALVESKNASVIRKWLGHSHIPQHLAEPVNAFSRRLAVAVPEPPQPVPVPHRSDRRQGTAALRDILCLLPDARNQ